MRFTEITKHKYFEIVVLVCVLALAAFLRFYKLSQIPNGFYVDEAAIGYNAYSFLETGKDEYGKAYPIFLRSFGAYSSPLYTYLTTVSVYLFDLSVFSTRFLSAFSGLLTTLFVYLIFRKLVEKSHFALLGTFIFAVSPWSIFFSRGSFEANFALFLISVSIYFALLAKEKTMYLIPCFILLSLSTYAYQAERLIVFLLVPFLLFWIGGKRTLVLVKRKEVVFALFAFILIQLPQLSLLTTDAFGARASGIFYKDAVSGLTKRIVLLPYGVAYLLSFIREFSSNYIAYFSPKNLFFLPDPDLQRSLPELSVFFGWMVVPYIIGLFVFVGTFKTGKNCWIMLCLLLIAPIPAALTRDPFSTLRALPLVIPMTFILTLGTEILIRRILNLKLGFIILSILLISIMLVSTLSFWRSYFVLFPNERAAEWDYGFAQLGTIVSEDPETHYVIDQSRMSPAYILLAFHMQIPPSDIHAFVDLGVKDNYYNGREFDSYYQLSNFETRPINWKEDIYKEQVLVGDRYAVSEGQMKEHFLEKVFEITDPLHEPVFIGYKTNPKEKCESVKSTDLGC